MKYAKLITVLIIIFLPLLTVDAQETAQYVGVAKCKACHMSASSGAQFKLWQKSPHSKAYEVLGTERGIKVARDLGVEGDPQKEDRCLKCHSTAHGVAPELLADGFNDTLGVQCEACHGPGSLYRKPSIMNRKKFREDPHALRTLWKELGLIIPDEEACKKCHTEEGFTFEEKFKLIAHPLPDSPPRKQ